MVNFSKSTLNQEILGWVEAAPNVIPKNVTPANNLLLNSYFENLTVELHFLYIFLTCMPIFMPIKCYLPFDP